MSAREKEQRRYVDGVARRGGKGKRRKNFGAPTHPNHRRANMSNVCAPSLRSPRAPCFFVIIKRRNVHCISNSIRNSNSIPLRPNYLRSLRCADRKEALVTCFVQKLHSCVSQYVNHKQQQQMFNSSRQAQRKTYDESIASIAEDLSDCFCVFKVRRLRVWGAMHELLHALHTRNV